MNISIFISNFSKKTVILQPWNYAYKIANALASLGNNVTLFTNRQSGFFPASSFLDAPFRLLTVSGFRSLNGGDLRIIEKEEPDVIYWFGNSLSGISIRKAKCLQIPLVLHISAPHYSLSDLRSLSLRDALRHWIHLLTAVPPGSIVVRMLNDDTIGFITVPNEVMKNRLSELGVSKEKIMVAPLSFEAKGFIYADSKTMLNARKELGFGKEEFIATYLGSPDTVRGTDILLRSANILKSRLRDFTIVILSRRDHIERSEDEKMLFQLLRKNDLPDVVKIVPGILSKEIVKSYLSASNVIVLPFKITQCEPPLAILEAMAIGKPVVTTKTCGLHEIIDFDRGFLVRPKDANDLARALYYLSQNPETATELGQRARDFVLELPSWNDLGKWTEKVLCQAIKKN